MNIGAGLEIVISIAFNSSANSKFGEWRFYRRLLFIDGIAQ